jgi:hypothetical protein
VSVGNHSDCDMYWRKLVVSVGDIRLHCMLEGEDCSECWRRNIKVRVG